MSKWKSRDEIVEHFREIREDPMTPQYLVGMGQSGSLLDYQEAAALGEFACRYGHQGLGKPHTDDFKKFKRGPYHFCSRCGHRVCAICGTDVGSLIASWDTHARSCEGAEGMASDV